MLAGNSGSNKRQHLIKVTGRGSNNFFFVTIKVLIQTDQNRTTVGNMRSTPSDMSGTNTWKVQDIDIKQNI